MVKTKPTGVTGEVRPVLVGIKSYHALLQVKPCLQLLKNKTINMDNDKALALVEDYINTTDVEKLRCIFNLTGDFPKKNIFQFVIKTKDKNFLERIAENHLETINRKYFYFKDKDED